MESATAPFELPIRVYFQDTDAGGVVFHGTYLNFLERARTEWLRTFGIELPAWTAANGLLFIVRRVELAYRAPAKLDNLLRVSAALKTCGRAQLTLTQQVIRDNMILVDGTVNLACVSSDGLRPMPLPDSIYRQLVPDAVRVKQGESK